MTKIKIFIDKNSKTLETDINIWIREKKPKIKLMQSSMDADHSVFLKDQVVSIIFLYD